MGQSAACPRSVARKRCAVLFARSPAKGGAASRRSLSLAVLVAIVALSLGAAGCRRLLVRQYEYEEEVYLSLDGSATVYVNASVPALAALRGVDLDTNPRARVDRAQIRALYTSPVSRVVRVSTSRRSNRRFVHVRLEVDDIRQLPRAAPFSWSTYRLDRDGDVYVFRQTVDGSAGKAVGDVGWTGRELVAFRLHLPSKIRFHNAQAFSRGNILAWEQPLAARQAGTPLSMEARMETQSILYRTRWLFGFTFVAVALTFAVVIWWVLRSGRVQELAGRA